VIALFFLNATSGQLPMTFVQALLALSYRPVPLAGARGERAREREREREKVVDIGIQRTLDAIGERTGDVLLASHDGDFLPHIERLLGGDHRVGLIAFKEFVNSGFAPLRDAGLESSTSRTTSTHPPAHYPECESSRSRHSIRSGTSDPPAAAGIPAGPVEWAELSEVPLISCVFLPMV
jgi:hypothetical protein